MIPKYLLLFLNESILTSMILRMLIIMMSGKRKSGKDFVASKLYKHFGDNISIIRLSAPLKKAFATENNLDYENLLTSGMYKELYRKVTFITSKVL